MSQQDQANEFHVPCKFIPWDPTWRTSTCEELAELRKTLMAQEEVGTVLTSTTVNRGAISTVTLTGPRLNYMVMGVKGQARTLGCVKENIITTTNYGVDERTKVWQRYYTTEGYVWKPTYNENPSHPKHMKSQSIPMRGDQLMEELVQLSGARAGKVKGDNARKCQALTEVLQRVRWKEDLTREEMWELSNHIVKILHVFTNIHSLHDEFIYEALVVLDRVAVIPPNYGNGPESPVSPVHPLLEAYNAYRLSQQPIP